MTFIRSGRRALPWLAVTVGAVVSCSEAPLSVNCLDYMAPSIVVIVRDAETSAPVAAGATLVQKGEGYADSVSIAVDLLSSGDPALAVISAYERPGTYDVSVRRSGYATWERASVHVEPGVCHVQTVELEARLVAVP